MTRTCDVCGKECNEKLMEHYFTGTKTEWWCWDCWKKGAYEAGKSEAHRRQKRYMIAKEKGLIK